MPSITYRTQDIDYLGFLETKLRDLRGIPTLAYELIQNADDVKDELGNPATTLIRFDIRDDALIVENDGVFRPVDFERMQHIASGGKRDEEGTTGAFGIGFISVYQITDSPEIISSGVHWAFQPAESPDKRIIEVPENTLGTRFRLPWAYDPKSPVRRKLRLEAVESQQIEGFASQVSEAVASAALFLKQLQVLEVLRNGRLYSRFRREDGGDGQIMVEDHQNNLIIWNIFHANFETTADRLRSYYPIEKKRHSRVRIAIPDEPLADGRLYAVLPSETRLSLPFHIDADFFPSSDRKRIDLETGYQAEWNKAAIEAAARAVAYNLKRLPDMLGHVGLWRFIEQLDATRQATERGTQNAVFAAFWREIAPLLSKSAIVRTSSGAWVEPAKARLLESEAEQEAQPILERLGIPVVHPELRRFYGLMRQSGVPLLSVDDVVAGLAKVKMVSGIPIAEAPAGLRDHSSWNLLWKALDAIQNRRLQSQETISSSWRKIGLAPLAVSQDKRIYRPSELFRGDKETREVFPQVTWLHSSIGEGAIPGNCVPEFGLLEALEYLESEPNELEVAGQLDVSSLFRWLEHHRAHIELSVEERRRLLSLPLYPHGDKLLPLEQLFLPSNFEDPVGVASVLDVQALGVTRDFLRALGVAELTFANYVRQAVPHVFENNDDVPAETRHQLLELIARSLSEIREDSSVKRILKDVPLIPCDDDQFRKPAEVYGRALVRDVLGSNYPVAKPAETLNIEELYRWLDIPSDPRPADLIRHVRQLIKTQPDEWSVARIKDVFDYLAGRWPAWDQSARDEFNQLTQLAWLPGSKDLARWFLPSEVYSDFRQYLFESQGNFLLIPRAIQSKASTTDFMRFLGIRTDPEPKAVVRHLLLYSRKSKPVNKEVYRFLNDNAEDGAIDQLLPEPCILLPDETYARPDQVFWNQHSFGRFRYWLGGELRRYDALLERLGVREAPEPVDYIRVLLDISREFATGSRILDDEAYDVVLHCWSELTAAASDRRMDTSDLLSLCKEPVIPDARHMLRPPERVYFEDRVGLAAKFDGLLDHDVVPRPHGAWQAMHAVGVRFLSDVIELDFVESPDAVHDRQLSEHVRGRERLLQRIFESENQNAAHPLDLDRFKAIDYQLAQRLRVRYIFRGLLQPRFSSAEELPALYKSDDGLLFVTRENGHYSWQDIAREMAYALKQYREVGSLAIAIRDVLAAEKLSEIELSLDKLGYPPLDWLEFVRTEIVPIGELGGEDAPDETPDSYVHDPIAGILGALPPRRAEMPGSDEREQEVRRGTDGTGTSAPGPRPVTQPSGGTSNGRGIRNDRGGEMRTSYVFPAQGDKPSDASRQTQAKRGAVEQAAVNRAVNFEQENGREPQVMPPKNEGYDIQSLDDDGELRYIEVKGLNGAWSRANPVLMTAAEHRFGRSKGEAYWLYVIEHTGNPELTNLYAIQDPVNTIDRYAFDYGWQQFAQSEDAPLSDDGEEE